MATKPRTIDEYLATVKDDQRAALEKLRATIKSAAPSAEEGISYGLAAFRLDGRPLVAIGATEKHCAFYPMSATTIAAHSTDLSGYDTSKGTVRFLPSKPLPATLVRKLVKTRIAEHSANAKPASSKSRAAPRPAVAVAKTPKRPTEDVAAFLAALDHPLKREFETVRTIILGADPTIEEGIKWNAPSFRTREYFATFHHRSTDTIQLVFHLGAKVKDNSRAKLQIDDPAGLIKWLANDRCLVTLGAGKAIQANKAAFVAIVRRWISFL